MKQKTKLGELIARIAKNNNIKMYIMAATLGITKSTLYAVMEGRTRFKDTALKIFLGTYFESENTHEYIRELNRLNNCRFSLDISDKNIVDRLNIRIIIEDLLVADADTLENLIRNDWGLINNN